MNPLISIITASYNKAGLIAETIESVIRQRYMFWELIIIDDASTDGSQAIIDEYSKKDTRIKTFFEAGNRGANYCRNIGIKESQGEFIVFLDADDLLDKECLTERVKVMEENPKLDFSVHVMKIFRKDIGDNNFKWIPKSKTPLEDFLSHKLPWQTMQPIWKRQFLIDLGGFDEKFQRLQDVELHTRALLSKDLKYKLIQDAPDCYYRTDDERKNFNEYRFLERWLNSALLYCDKFKSSEHVKINKLLLGTIFQTYVQILLSYSLKKITKSEYELLEEKLIQYELVQDSGVFKKKVFKFMKFYNLYFIRIPGVNRFIKYLLIF